MSAQNFIIMNVLRIITPEEISEIATKHNGGKFLSLTDLVNERVDKKIYRDFSTTDYMEELHELSEAKKGAKILPFKKALAPEGETPESADSSSDTTHFSTVATDELEAKAGQERISNNLNEKSNKVEHAESENMSSFILIEKARLQRSQKILKQKEIIDLYNKNSNVDVEQIRGSNSNLEQSSEAGVLVNKKQY